MMGRQTCKLVAVAAVAALLIAAVDRPSYGAEHKVGDETGWTIPPYDDLYGEWSSSRTFRAGDTLLFEFDPGFYDVMQVSRTEYDDCTADQPFVAFSDEAPVAVPLMESGVFYYVCSVLNYCSLGQKLNVSVQPAAPPPSSPVPLPASG